MRITEGRSIGADARASGKFMLDISPCIADYGFYKPRYCRHANLLKYKTSNNKAVTRMGKKRAEKVVLGGADLPDSSQDGEKEGAVSHRPLSMERRKPQGLSREVTEQVQELELLAQSLLQSQEAQQQTISRELHDNIAQVLSAATARLSLAADNRISAWLRQELTDLREQLKAAIDDVRTLARDLRPPILDHNGFAAALEKHVDAFRGRTRMSLDIQIDPKAASILNSESLTHLFRLSQEALQNIEEHSQATRAWLRIEQLDGHMHLEIGDNGNGFTEHRVKEAQRDGHLGLLGMRERAELLGGSFLLETIPAQGTSIRVTIPPPAKTTLINNHENHLSPHS